MESLREIIDRVLPLLSYDPQAPMLFSSGLFLFLFAAFAFFYGFMRRTPALRIWYVIAFSLYFYYKSSGIYLLLLWRQNRRSWLFYTCAVSLFIIPFFKVGQGCDFCMRVSIPAIFILMTLCARYFIALVGTKWRDGTLAQHAVTILLAATLLANGRLDWQGSNAMLPLALLLGGLLGGALTALRAGR